MAIYVRESATRAHPEVNEVRSNCGCGFLSVRAFDAAAMLLEADVVDGTALVQVIERLSTTRAWPVCTCTTPRRAVMPHG